MVRLVAASLMFFALTLSVPRVARGAEGDAALLRALGDGGTARVARVLDDGSLDLADHRIVRLIGVRIPSNGRWRREADKELEDLTEKQGISLRFDTRRRDRYGHSLAQVVTTDGRWLQGVLVRRGLARVESFADNRAMIRPLLALEDAARRSRVGLWSDPAFAVASSDAIAKHPSPYLKHFGIVEGTVVAVADRANWTFVNFGADWHKDFTVAVAAGDRRAVKNEGIDLDALTGRRIRVRGWIRDWNGPVIEIDHAEQIERLDAPRAVAQTDSQ